MRNLIILYVATVVFVSNSCSSKKDQPAVRSAPVMGINQMPAVTLINPEGKRFSAKDLPGKSILIFFGATCDHCQREAAQIRDNLSGFQGYTICFIGMDSFPVMSKFADDYGLSHQPNISFMRADGLTVSNALGYLQTPTVFIYSNSKTLIKRFDGETNIKEILKVL